MASQIETISSPQIPEQPRALVVHLKGEASLDRLASILEGVGNRMYKTWKDPLSFKLWDWGTKVCKVNLAKAFMDEESFKTEVKTFLTVLDRILVDRFSGFGLQDPVFVKETGWTCERAHIESCKISGLTLITNDFAKEMLAWVASLTLDVPSDALVARVSLETQIVRGNGYSQEDKESMKRSFFNTYRMAAKQEWMKFRLNQFIKEEIKESEEMACFLEIIDQRAKVLVKRAKEEAETGREKLEERIGSMEKTTQEKFEVLHTRESELRVKADNAEADVLKLKIQAMQQEGDIRSLRYEYARRCEELERVRREARRDRDSCTIL